MIEGPGVAANVLVVDDDPELGEMVAAFVRRLGHDAMFTQQPGEALSLLTTQPFDLVITDLHMSLMDGITLCGRIAGAQPDVPVIVLTGHGSLETAVAAMRAGAYDYLTKPVNTEVLTMSIARALERGHLRREVLRLRDEVGRVKPSRALVGSSRAMRELHDLTSRVAATDATVLINGESGTGKELVARTIVALSARAKKPFVVVNAAAIPESLVEAELFGSEKGAFTGADRARVGLFEEAHSGTLFLDEITEMPMPLQPKLLRTLEDGRIRRLGARVEIPCDVRVIAATNRNPTVAVERGLLRHDLIYRLDVLRVDVPPLRDRRSDIPLLTSWFISDCARRYDVPVPDIDAEALAVLDQHGWPGNIRELRNVIERAFVLAAPLAITAIHLGLARTEPGLVAVAGDDGTGEDGDDLDDTGPHGIVIPHGLTLADAERIVIVETLKRTGNNKAEAARRLGLDVKTIRNKLKAFGIDGSSP